MSVLILLALWLGGCAVTPITGFELRRYLGSWCEIARLDHAFERGLSNVSATYRRRDDDGVQVLNHGYDDRAGIWQEAEGRA